MKKSCFTVCMAILLGLLLAGCGKDEKQEVTPTTSVTETPTVTSTPEVTPTPTLSAEEQQWQQVAEDLMSDRFDLTNALMTDGLKDLCANYFKLGVGLTGSGASNAAVLSKEYMAVTKKHFNSVTLTNLMKPAHLLDQKGSQKSEDGMPAVKFDAVIPTLDWCKENGVSMRGHTLVWHTQTPDWFFKEGYTSEGALVDRDTMLKRMDSYIGQVLTFCQTNYPGVLYCWDVVNEAVDPDAGDPNSFYNCRMTNGDERNYWYYTIGNDYVEQAFIVARKYAAEGVKLFYNDYNTYETKKRQCIYDLCKYLADRGLIDGIGMQGYWGTSYPQLSAIENTIKKYAELGLEIQITELTVDIDDLSEKSLEAQAARYAMLFFTFQDLDTQGGGPANITAVTLFGLMDGYVFYANDDSTSRLFDTNLQPKPAFDKVQAILRTLYQ